MRAREPEARNHAREAKMAIFHFTAKNVSRGKGQSAVAKAAYNSREVLLDERDGKIKNYRNAGDVEWSGIFAPEDAPEWVKDREQLWNAVEAKEKRSDSQLAIEIEVALPHEFTDQQREWLVKDFAREQFSRQGFVADVNIHPPPRDPERETDKPNHHAHILVALREIGPEGFGERGLNSGTLQENSQQIEQWREKWENLVNRHLERHGFEERIDRRTLEEQGIDREPTKHRGPAVDAMERKNIETERGGFDNDPHVIVGYRPDTCEFLTLRESTVREFDRQIEWWERIEEAIERGAGSSAARERQADGFANSSKADARAELENMRELRSGLVEMRQEVRRELQNENLSREHQHALREIATELRELHHETAREITVLALEQSDYEPRVIEMGRSKLSEFGQTLNGALSGANDLVGGAVDMMASYVEELINFFDTPSLPTPELIHARRDAREAKIERAEFEGARDKEDDVRVAQVDQQERAKRELEEKEYARKQERELYPNEREIER